MYDCMDMLQFLKSWLPARKPTSPSKKIDWNSRQNKLPWFDLPSAEAHIDMKLRNKEIDEPTAMNLRKWVKDGYVVIDSGLSDDIISGYKSDYDDLFHSNKPHLNNVDILGVQHFDPRLDKEISANFKAEVFRKLSDKDKHSVLKSTFRVHDFHNMSPSGQQIFNAKKTQDLINHIFDQQGYPRSSITFLRGSTQLLHQDMAVFHVFPHNYLIGAWYALEDVHPDSGPLVFFPGSHKDSMWKGFNNYPQTQLRTALKPEYDGYHNYIDELSKKYERKEFIAKKGQVLLWHGMLIHGGSPLKNRDLTRKSFVVHYLTKDVDQTEHIHGPFNWS
jgi:phytanoyl-CoA hydroxylase